MARSNDFSRGPVWKCIIVQAVPLMIAQLVQLLYNVVDRIYLGHMGDGDSMALTGVGLTFPIITLIMAFTALFGNGGVPLFSMARGEKNEERAGQILGNSCALLLVSSVFLTAGGYLLCKPLLYLFGASPDSYPYARAYLDIYLVGTVFSMLATGLNGYINAQGYPKIGMASIILGAVSNIILDPIFIFVFDMGVAGAALATIISQALSALWVIRFLTGNTIHIPLRLRNLRIGWGITWEIFRLGTANFIMQGTNCLVQAVCNSTLQIFGGDLYVGVMTVVNSVREITMLPISGIVGGGQPVISFNYGAKDYRRVRSGIRFNTFIGTTLTLAGWAAVVLFPEFWFGLFSDDPGQLAAGIKALNIYFFGYVFMAFQMAGQTTFTALGDAKHAITFSLLRKAIIVAPLTLLLPRLGFGVQGVFLAEPISNVIGGLACYITMRLTVYKEILQKLKVENG